MNKVILMGRLTKDPEVRYTQTNNTLVASFPLAVNRRFARQGEERQADFINIGKTKTNKDIMLQRLLLKKLILQIAKKIQMEAQVLQIHSEIQYRKHLNLQFQMKMTYHFNNITCERGIYNGR